MTNEQGARQGRVRREEKERRAKRRGIRNALDNPRFSPPLLSLFLIPSTYPTKLYTSGTRTREHPLPVGTYIACALLLPVLLVQSTLFRWGSKEKGIDHICNCTSKRMEM